MKKKESRLIRISGKSVKNAMGFFYDGCHKIYVAESPEDVKTFSEMGYGERLMPMSEIEGVFKSSCPIRFISWCDVNKKCIVPQCAKRVKFSYDTHDSTVLMK